MTFKDYLYERPNIENIKVQFNSAINQFNRAISAAEQLEIFNLITNIRNDYETMNTLCSIRHSIDTTDHFYDDEMTFFNENNPYYEEINNDFNKQLFHSKFKDELKKELGEHLFNLIEVSLKTFSPKIIPLLQQENKLVTEYSKLKATAKIHFEGNDYPLPKMTPFMQSTNRQTRKSAEAAVSKFYQENHYKFGNIYDQLVKIRHEMAQELGFVNYVELGYAKLNRTDYNPEMVKSYRDQVYKELVPLVSELSLEKAKRIGVDNPKSYDFSLNYLNGNPKPKGDRQWMVERAMQMYQEMSSETKEFFEFMCNHQLLDLDAKAGKQGGGYCTYIANYQSPFIFANFNGTSGDVDVLTHEAGHAFQVYSSRHFNIPEYLFPTLEACEIHSMSMEFFAWPWMGLFFLEDTDKYQYSHLAESIIFIPYGVLVDEFQHGVYQNPSLTPDQRLALWRKLEHKYLPHKQYEDEFLNQGSFWYRQGHIFSSPFYYIDYTLAQICAHQFWIKDQNNHENAWQDYYQLCQVGGSKSFLELLKIAKLQNPFEEGTVKNVIAPLKEWLNNFDQKKLK